MRVTTVESGLLILPGSLPACPACGGAIATAAISSLRFAAASDHSLPAEVSDRADADRDAVRQKQHVRLTGRGNLGELARILDVDDLGEDQHGVAIVLVPGLPL